jgi:hypothetical protein
MKTGNKATGRREFISTLSAAAAIGILGKTGIMENSSDVSSGNEIQQTTILPEISLGPHRISRLICGSNPLLGYSYMGSHTDKHMKEYFTTERTVNFLMECEMAGITGHQCSMRFDYFPALRERRSRLKIICLSDDAGKIDEVAAAAEPIAIVHHGGVTDRLFGQGKSDVVHDYVKKVKDKGLLAGVSAHNPDVVKKIADDGWEVDFFMTCFYHLTRKLEKSEDTILPLGGYSFFKDDPVKMTNVIKQVKQPCLAFKILGAGRYCTSQEKVLSAFRFAYENIKPTDGVIVGMFPWLFNEIQANTQYARELS